jgi:protease-4
MTKTRRRGLLFFCVVMGMVAGSLFVSLFGFPHWDGHGSRFGSDYLGILDVTGVIQGDGDTYNQGWFLDQVAALKDDPRNVGLFLYIDSPGGSVYDADEAYLALRDYADTGKPLWAYLGPMAASGGYYIACAAPRILANRNTLTGSIGVISGQSVDLTGLFEKYGIKMHTFTSGKNKNMLGLDSPLTAEQAAIMQSIADEYYEQFVDIVAEARGLPVDTVRTLADGRLYTARQALDASLVDELSGYDDALDRFYDLLLPHCDGDLKTRSFSYKAPPKLTDLLSPLLAP